MQNKGNEMRARSLLPAKIFFMHRNFVQGKFSMYSFIIKNAK